MNLLLLTPSPNATESLLGYVLRISERNGYESPWHVLSLAGFSPGEMRSAGFPIHKLATVLGCRPEELDRISYRAAAPAKEFKLLGETVGVSLNCSPLRLRNPSICPCCVQDSGHIDAFWDLTFAVACPDHGTRSLEICPECNELLTWYRPGLLRCKCGADLGSVERPEADIAVVQMMQILRAKAHGLEKPELSSTLLPLDLLWQLPLRSLLELIGALGNYTHLADLKGDSVSSFETLTSAVTALRDWPTNFHSLLRKMATRSNTNSMTLRARFESFYKSMFKRRKKAADFTFLKDEFIRFGMAEWKDGVVDKRMLDGDMAEHRFMSKLSLANFVDVDVRTISSWAKSGKLEIREFQLAHQKRYVADASKFLVPVKAAGACIQERDAAKFVGIPVSALSYLKASGHYAVRHMPAFKIGYHEADLAAFHTALCERSTLLDRSVCDATVTLGYVMQELRFWSSDGKGKFIAAYLDGKLPSIGRLDNRIQSIEFRKTDVQDFTQQCRAEASSGAISQKEAARIIGCDRRAIADLIRLGHLVGFPGAARLRVTGESVQQFSERLLSLLSLAKQLCTSVARLERICGASNIELFRVAKNDAGSSLYVARAMEEKVRCLVRENRPTQRLSPSDSLTRYLDGMRQESLLLPRRAGEPNLVAIAKSCKFDRNAFYNNAATLGILREYQKEEEIRYGIRKKCAPAVALQEYLDNLSANNNPLPMRGGHPNKLRIAKICGFKRDCFYELPELNRLLATH